MRWPNRPAEPLGAGFRRRLHYSPGSYILPIEAARRRRAISKKGARLLTGIVAVLQLLISLALIFLVLLHSGKSGGVGDMFGGGMGGGAVGGSTVMEKNLDRLTVITAVLFAISTLALTWLLA